MAKRKVDSTKKSGSPKSKVKNQKASLSKKDKNAQTKRTKNSSKTRSVSKRRGATTKKTIPSLTKPAQQKSVSKARRTPLKVVFVASEAVPLVKVGGLADVVGSLPKALRRRGVDVLVILPEYRAVKNSGWDVKETGIKVSSPIGSSWLEANIDSVEVDGVPFFLVRHDPYFDREGVYGENGEDYPDNLERYAFFNKITLELLKRLDYKPDVIHCNDWQTGLIPVFKDAFYSSDPFYEGVKTVFGLHNLAYQGLFPVEKFYLLGLDWSYFTYQGIEFYGRVNCLKAGLMYSDVIVTVSPRYAKEIQTPEYGWGLDGVLRSRRDKLFGILNGIDYEYWDPWKDPFIFEKFGMRGNKAYLKGKLVNKVRLLESEGLKVEDGQRPLVSIVSRLVHQKGIDLAVDAVSHLLESGRLYFVVLGRGEPGLEQKLVHLQEKFPESVRVHLEFNEALAHQLYAGSDLILIPSRFEPCGLTQMIAMRYGTIPVVRRTGGLADTVDENVGFLFDKPETDELLSTLDVALNAVGGKDWNKRIKLAMSKDFSWDRSAEEYLKLYSRLKRKK